jgi:hypothetical protein
LTVSLGFFKIMAASTVARVARRRVRRARRARNVGGYMLEDESAEESRMVELSGKFGAGKHFGEV